MPYTGPTAGYLAAAQDNDTQLGYILESTYGVVQNATPYQLARFTGESFRKQKSRSRPQEINAADEDSQSVTTQETVSGTMNAAMSFGSHDDFLAGAMDNDFTNLLITTTASGGALSVSVATMDPVAGVTLFWPNNSAATWPASGTLRVSGTANAFLPPGLYLFSIVNAAGIVLWPTSAAQTPIATGALPAGVKLSCQTLRNAKLFKSFTVIEAMPALSGGFVRAGGYVSSATLTLAQNAFATADFMFMFASQGKYLTSPASSLLAAPSGYVHDTINGFGGLFINHLAVSAKVMQVAVTISSTGAAQDYVMGQVTAAGQRPGSFNAAGTCQILFKSFAEYSLFEAEASSVIQTITQDNLGNAYGLTFLNATLQNPQINTATKNGKIVASFDIEGNPQAGGGTFQIDRLPIGV